MRCSKSARSAKALLVVASLVVAWATPSAAQRVRSSSSEEEERAENMKMPNVSIEGERQTPDIFFVFPTGKGGNLSAPRMRDYAADILEPVVKPWFEKDQSVNLQARVSSGEKFDWEEALRSEPDRAPAPQAPAMGAAMPPSMPPSASSLPPTANAMPSTANQFPSANQFPTANQMPPTANRIPPPAQYPATANPMPQSAYPAPAPANQAPPSQGQLGTRYSVEPRPPGGAYQPQIPSQALSLPPSSR